MHYIFAQTRPKKNWEPCFDYNYNDKLSENSLSLYTISEVKPLRISLTVSAKSNQLEVSWFHAKPREGYILITNEEPREPFRRYEKIDIDVIDEPIDETLEPTSTTFPSLITESSEEVFRTPPPGTQKTIWTFGPDNKTAVHWLQPEEETAWMTTHIPFDNNLTRNITIQTRCYGFWAVYISNEGTILANTCISAQPTWMNDMRDHIKGFRFCNLFIVGSHDSGSFRTNFNPHGHDSIVTKYSLTQVIVFFLFLFWLKQNINNASNCLLLFSLSAIMNNRRMTSPAN